MRRFLFTVAKLAVSAALLGYVIVEAQRSDPGTFAGLRDTAPKWPVLVLGWSCLMAALSAGVVRWYAVLGALGISTRLRRVFRYATLAFALDFVALGTAGGDLVKGLFLARDQPGSRPLVLTSVLIDRIFGLYCLLTISAFVLIVADPLEQELYPLRLGVLTAALGINVALGLLWVVPGLGRFLERLSPRLGGFGSALAGVVPALRQLRDRPQSMIPVAFANLAALTFLISGLYFVAVSLPGEMPTFAEQCEIMPLAMLSDLLPLPGGTLGALDFAMSYLYQHVSGGRVPLGQGMLVAMLSRVVNIVVVGIAVGLYVKTERQRRP